MTSSGRDGRHTVRRNPLWLTTLSPYLLVIAAGNILWEFVQLPGFTLWSRVGWNWFIFVPVLGTAGDILIAATSLVLALVLIGDDNWPLRRASYWSVAALATLQGIAYTAYSEWRHAVVLHHWTYSALMPVVPELGVGLFPLCNGCLSRHWLSFTRYTRCQLMIEISRF
jgi:hypothetical protein